MKKVFAVTLFVLVSQVFIIAQVKPIKDLSPTVILVSLDGFRADYLDRYDAPNLRELAKGGVRAKFMIPAFPTKTFPNHYTIATGLYPENHGIIENNIYDKRFDAVFGLSKREEVENPRWWLGEPIWITAELQGQKAGTFFFPGTETEIKGKRPTYWKAYKHDLPYPERTETILSWLDFPREKRPTFFTLYFDEPDSAGHACGPESECVATAVKRVDTEIGRLINGLKARKIFKKVNVIVVSDHGMAKIENKNTTLLDDYFDFSNTERILWTGEIVQIFPKEKKEDEIIAGLKNLQTANCWRKTEIPARLRYQASERIAPIVCSAKESQILSNRQWFERIKKNEDFDKPRGAHGYDNQLETMRATFIAHGKAFKKGKVVEPFANVDVYNVMAKILNLKPAPNDGNPETIKKLLR